jgi:hypothetical protein
MAIQYTTEALRRQIDGGMRMQELAEIFSDVEYSELYLKVKEVSGGRVIRAGDTYWMELVQGQTITGLSKSTGVAAESIVKAIEKCGYDLDSVEETDDYGFTLMMPSRLVRAWESLGSRAMTYLRMVIDKTKEIVDTGTPVVRMRLSDEDRELLSLPLTPDDFELIDHFNQHSVSMTGAVHIPNRGRSKIVRALITQMVDSMPELSAFRAESSYPPAVNYLGATWATTFNAPVYLWLQAEQIKGKRGQSAPNLSSLMRETVQRVIDDPSILDQTPDPVSYTQPPKFNAIFAEDGEEWRFNQPVLTVTLLENQKAPVQKIRADIGLDQRGGHSIFMCKVLAIAINLQQATLPGWAEYLDFVQRSWGREDLPQVRQHLERMKRQGFVVNTQL